MIELKEVMKSYDGTRAVDKLSVLIEDGSAYGIIGASGSGKTSIVRLMLGLIQPDSGEILLDGMHAGSNVRRLKKRVGYVPDQPGSYPGLTVSEYMSFFASCYELSGTQTKRRIRFLLEQVGLSGREAQQVDGLTRSLRKKLSIAGSLIHEPRILIMDEPTKGLDPAGRYDVKGLISELYNEGKTIVLTSGSLSECSELCTHIGVLDYGRLLLEGSVSEVLKQLNSSSPIILSLGGGLSAAMRVLRHDKRVRSISVKNQELWIRYDGSQENESELLSEFIKEGIPVRGFHREKGNLEALLLKLNGDRGERVVTSYDAESDF